MRRVVAYIDGFNLYHSINKTLGDDYKWIDYRKMVEKYIGGDDTLVDIFLFTAEPYWRKPEKLIKHRTFMDVTTKYSRVRIINGNYSSVTRNFDGLKMDVIDKQTKAKLNILVNPRIFSYNTFEEKQTDVNIALYILEGAFKDYYDKAIIFSGDSDIAPSIIMAAKHFPTKKFTCVLPINGKGKVMSRACNSTKILNNDVLEKSRLPDEIDINGVMYTNPYKKQDPSQSDGSQGGGLLTGCI